jgi:hypothetical protein
VRSGFRPRARRAKRQDQPRFVRVSDSLQCHLIAGAWHQVSVKPLPLVRESCPEREVVRDRPVATIDSAMARKQYGADVYAVGKRRLARRELSQFPVPVDLWTGGG